MPRGILIGKAGATEDNPARQGKTYQRDCRRRKGGQLKFPGGVYSLRRYIYDMKLGVKCWVGAVAGLGAVTMVCGVTGDSADSPYKVISDRNVFGLKSPPPPPSPESLKPPPPAIKLQGITRMLDRRQVLFKVTLPARPPDPAKEVGMVLNEGERSGE